jgi:hypothetical protein
MNRTDRCPECSGGGLVPALRCTCGGNAHTCMPVICTLCYRQGPGPLRACEYRSAKRGS